MADENYSPEFEALLKREGVDRCKFSEIRDADAKKYVKLPDPLDNLHMMVDAAREMKDKQEYEPGKGVRPKEAVNMLHDSYVKRHKITATKCVKPRQI